MKWIVGVDLRHGCDGALGWARWVRKRDRNIEFLAAHAMEVPKGLLIPSVDMVAEHVTKYVSQRIADVEVRVLEEQPPEVALAHAIAIHGADALAIGRRATRDGDGLVRLGAVARRLLRKLPAPILVCPPDLRSEDIPEGPVLVCVQPNAEGAAALRFGRQVAKTAGLPLQALTVLPPIYPLGVSYLPAPTNGADEHERRENAMREWLAEQPGDGVELMVSDGPVVPTILQAADAVQACMIVCGSRLLSAVERFFNTSVGTALAGSARVPVAVVPPST